MKTFIRCVENRKGVHDFYVLHEDCEYYLFSQRFHVGVNSYFKNGVLLDYALNFKTAKGDCCVIKTMSKLKSYIKYIEKENDLKILKETIKKGLTNKKKDCWLDLKEYYAY